MRILVVEDERVICEQIKKFLADKGFAVDTASNGNDGYFLGKEYPVSYTHLTLPTKRIV